MNKRTGNTLLKIIYDLRESFFVKDTTRRDDPMRGGNFHVNEHRITLVTW